MKVGFPFTLAPTRQTGIAYGIVVFSIFTFANSEISFTILENRKYLNGKGESLAVGVEMGSDTLDICLGSGGPMIKLLGSRGTLDILCVFTTGTNTVRFNKLYGLLGHISTKTLTSRLRELEGNGILKRTAYNEIPPRVEYSITEKGQRLTEALVPLVLWVEEWADKEGRAH